MHLLYTRCTFLLSVDGLEAKAIYRFASQNIFPFSHSPASSIPCVYRPLSMCSSISNLIATHQGFVTAVQQEVTRAHKADRWSLDGVVLHTEVEYHKINFLMHIKGSPKFQCLPMVATIRAFSYSEYSMFFMRGNSNSSATKSRRTLLK